MASLAASLWSDHLRQELQHPRTQLGNRYLGMLIITIILSVLYLFIQEEYPNAFPLGSVFGIALAITFGITKRKQIEISELHRLALDTLDRMERDIRHLNPKSGWKGSAEWRKDIALFLDEKLDYREMKTRTQVLLDDIRAGIINRPSLDVPFHNNLVVRISQFLTKTQIEFHPVFYRWLNRIAQLYFILVLLAAPGLTGVFVQLLVIFVFQGLVVIIDDMDHAVDTKVTLFNSKILDV